MYECLSRQKKTDCCKMFARYFRINQQFQIYKLHHLYSQSAQFGPFFEPIFPQNGPICASHRKKSVFIEKFVKIWF